VFEWLPETEKGKCPAETWKPKIILKGPKALSDRCGSIKGGQMDRISEDEMTQFIFGDAITLILHGMGSNSNERSSQSMRGHLEPEE